MAPVRTLSSFFLLILMALNTIGFYAFLVVERDHVASVTVQKLQSNINELGGNMIVKLPLSVPYGNDSEEYEPADGSFTFEGKIYRLIKKRLYRDTLYLVSIYDYKTTEANHKIDEFARAFTGNEKQQPENAKLISSLYKDYFIPTYQIEPDSNGWLLLYSFPFFINGYQSISILDIFRPPTFTT
ncbi:MAG: hypothetical protein C0490_09710 [Marivirga sp.]|nr:hypothetical protein [Marivirga sp.]